MTFNSSFFLKIIKNQYNILNQFQEAFDWHLQNLYFFFFL